MTDFSDLPIQRHPTSPPAIVSLGEVLWDLFPDGEQFGGAPANFACHAAIQGANVTMVSAVGNDSHGRAGIEILQGFGIDTSLIPILPDVPTGTVGVVLNELGKPTFTIHANSAWDRIAWNDALKDRVTAADAVYFGTLGQRSEMSRATIRRCVETARAAGIPRVLDINLRAPFYDAAMIRESIQLASILKLSDDELNEVRDACGLSWNDSPHESLRQLREFWNLDLVVMTRGAEGAVVASPNGIVEQPGIPTIVRDTVGAGDAFTATFLLGVLAGVSPAENLLKSCTIAAGVCAHAGAVPGKPRANLP